MKASKTPLRILMVEDSKDNAYLVIRELSKYHYEPIFERVDNPADLEAALQKKTWDVVTSDYRRTSNGNFQLIFRSLSDCPDYRGSRTGNFG